MTPRPARIELKRAYEAPAGDDGLRLLVERLWPRGVKRDAARIDHWFKELAPSTELRRWYDHIPERWPEFQARYEAELDAATPEAIGELIELCSTQPVTFVFAARDVTRNSAVVLRAYVLGRM
ncbi:MAG: DUF488 family protein [Hyphomicrobiales bacterium]|nr:DUF488 family protein [Hyphomicrobiales bacterium]